MPMTSAGMSAALKPAIDAAIRDNYTIIETVGDAELVKFAQSLADGIANAIVPYIQANAQVTGTTVVSGGSSSGSWPTTGTIS